MKRSPPTVAEVYKSMHGRETGQGANSPSFIMLETRDYRMILLSRFKEKRRNLFTRHIKLICATHCHEMWCWPLHTDGSKRTQGQLHGHVSYQQLLLGWQDRTSMSRGATSLNITRWHEGQQWERAAVFTPGLCGFPEHLIGHNATHDAGLDRSSLA